MVLKDLAFAFRNLRRNKLLAAIKVLGLSIGISACLLIFLITSHELRYDTFQSERGRIFRIYTTFSGVFNGVNNGIATGAADHVREQFTGLAAVAPFHLFKAKVEVPRKGSGSKDLGEASRTIIASPEYFEVFNYYEWVAGSAKQSLSDPFNVVITESRVKKYFGEIHPLDAIGREIHYQDSLAVFVSGIVKDITETTDLDFTDFISFPTIEKSWLKENIALNDWENTNSSSQLFIRLAPGTSQEDIQSQLPGLSQVFREHTTNPDWKTTPKLQSLGDLHFGTELGIFDGSRAVPPKATLRILVLVALLLLIIGSINFINLETAQASRHAREVGVRKVLGSSRAGIVTRFLLETFILSSLSVVLSVAWVELIIAFFPEYIPAGLTFEYGEPFIAVFLISCAVVVTLVAGLYPAAILSSYKPALALKNLAYGGTGTSRSAFIRQTLTVFQFGFSQILIIGTIAIGLQVDYMLNKNLGFETDAVITFELPQGASRTQRAAFQNELDQLPEIDRVSLHNTAPISGGVSSRIISYNNGEDIRQDNVHIKMCDSAYIRTYGIALLAGRNLLPSDSAQEYLINETYMRMLGFQEPRDALGTVLDERFTVVGVIKDFHTQSLRSGIPPAALTYLPHLRGVGIKLAVPTGKISDLRPGIEKIEKAWAKMFPDAPFEYRFMNEAIRGFYETESRTRKLAGAATAVAILISCLGLFGLASFTVIQRTKEIGVRKVLGATVNGIMFLLSRDFLLLVFIAFALSAPVAYYLASRWLESYAFRMELSAWIFVLAGLTSAITAFVTISFRTVAAAKADPVKSLRYE